MSARITLVSLSARMDAYEAAQHEINRTNTELLGKLVAQVGAFATPASVVTAITEAPSAKAPAKARKGKGAKATACKSFAAGEALAATGVHPDAITVPAGKLGREGTQTLTQARAKRAEAEASRVAYLADRKAGITPERKAQRAQVAADTAVIKGDAPKAAKATANPYFAMSRSALDADGSKGAKAEIARREAKRASKTA